MMKKRRAFSKSIERIVMNLIFFRTDKLQLLPIPASNEKALLNYRAKENFKQRAVY